MTAIPFQPVKYVAKFIEASVANSVQKSISTKLITVNTDSRFSTDLVYTNKFKGEDFALIPGKGLFASVGGQKVYNEQLKGHTKFFIVSNKEFVFMENNAPENTLCSGHSAKQTIKFLESSGEVELNILQSDLLGVSISSECSILEN